MAKEKAGKGLTLAFFLIFVYLPVQGDDGIPVINRLDSTDTGFKQYINDVESNRMRLTRNRNKPEETAEHLTIYQYTPKLGEDIFFLAARCNVPYSALVSLNRLTGPASLVSGKSLMIPSCPGIFLPASPESELEKLLGAVWHAKQKPVELKINIAGKTNSFYFFPGADYSSTERAFFLNPGFRFPLQSFRLTSSFGIRESPITGNISMHHGIDLAAPEGTEVYSIAEGTVIETGFNNVYGNYVVISHKDRLTSLYGHLQKIETVLQAAVNSGTLIGRVGSTGQSTGPHLHFELRQDGRAFDPAGRLRMLF